MFSFHTNTSLAYKLDRGVLKISAHVWASNQYANLALSHCFVSSSTNSLTLDGYGPFLRKHGGRGSHWCLAISIEVPLPAFHFDPFSIISCACSWLLHTYDGLLPNSASKKEQLEKYLAMYTLMNREFSWLISLHACLASIAKLKVFISQNPMLVWFI